VDDRWAPDDGDRTTVGDDGAARPDASRVINASRAGGGVSLRNLSHEHAESQQAGSNLFHCSTSFRQTRYRAGFRHLIARRRPLGGRTRAF
jgi:hypothetical protein